MAIVGALEAFQLALQRPDDEPRVDRQLVANHVERVEHVAHGVGDRPWSPLIDDEREQLAGRLIEQRCGIVADETGKGTRDTRQGFEDHRERCGAWPGRGVDELVTARRDGTNETHRGFGAFGVPAQPEEVFCCPRRQGIS